MNILYKFLKMNAYNPYSGGYPLPPPPPPPSGEEYGFSSGIGGITLSPAATVYLFPEYFSKKSSIGGFKSPCSGVKVKHDELFYSMVITTLLMMEKVKMIRFYTYREGKIFKRNRMGIVKLNNYDQIDFGYLGRRIVKLYPGINASIAGVIIEGVKSSPEKYFINQVYRYDLYNKGLFLNNDPKKPICEKIAMHRNRAEELYNLVNIFKNNRSQEYNLIKEEAGSVILDMQEEALY